MGRAGAGVLHAGAAAVTHGDRVQRQFDDGLVVTCKSQDWVVRQGQGPCFRQVGRDDTT